MSTGRVDPRVGSDQDFFYKLRRRYVIMTWSGLIRVVTDTAVEMVF